MAFGASTLAELLLGLYGPWLAHVAAGRPPEREDGRRLHPRQQRTTTGGVVVVSDKGSTLTIIRTSTADTVTVINPAKPTPTHSLLETAPPAPTTPPSPVSLTCDQGYLSCAADQGGGCCLSGWGCAADSCIPPATVTATRTCLPSSYLCPASVGGGCCPNGYSCGPTACQPANDLGPITVTRAGVVVVQTYQATATAAVPKATEEDIGVKLKPTAPAPSGSVSSAAAAAQGPKKPFATVKTASIAGGVCAAVIIIGLAVCFARRKAKRRGNTAWGAGHRSEIVAAPTGRAFDPNAPLKPRPLPPRHSRFDSGFYGGNRHTSGGHHPSSLDGGGGVVYHDDPRRQETKPGAAAYYYPSPHEKAYAPVPLDSPPPEAAYFGSGQSPRSPRAAELYDTSAQVGPRGVHEADGRERGRRMS